LKKEEMNSPEEPVKFLSPFDNVIRERHYPLNIWNFDYKLESYVPPNERQYGYHVLPILDGCNIVARVDAKVHRNENRLELKSLYLEHDFWKESHGLERLIDGLYEFGEFHEVKEISLEDVIPKPAKKKIRERLKR
jgi:uncharacterized protein YcaQ